MAQDDFAKLATAKNLEEATIELLKEKKYDTEEALSLMNGDQLNDLEISDNQRKALKAWLVELYVQYNRVDDITDKIQGKPTFDLKVTDEDGKESCPDKELDYAVPSTPRPSIYGKCINIAITGQISAGKSSLINALRGLTTKDPDAASTEFGAKKEEMVPYRLNKVDKMVLWDLPAVEEISDEYLKKVEFDQYDAIVVCSSERLSEWDVWLATVAAKGQIKAFLVRTKIDRDIESDKDDYGEGHNEEQLLERIRQDICSQIKDADVYIISSKQPHWAKWDFPKLETNITGVTKKENKSDIFSEDPAKPSTEVTIDVEPVVDGKRDKADSDKISVKSDDKKPSEVQKLEQLATKLKSDVPSVVDKAAKKGSVSSLKKELDKYKKEFKVNHMDLPGVNIDSLEEAVDKDTPAQSKGIKAKFMSCFGARSQGALSAEAKRKISDTINEGAPQLMESAINTCKEAAIQQLTK